MLSYADDIILVAKAAKELQDITRSMEIYYKQKNDAKSGKIQSNKIQKRRRKETERKVDNKR